MKFFEAVSACAEYIETKENQSRKLPLSILDKVSSDGSRIYQLRQEYRMGESSTELPTIVTTTYDESVGFNPVHMVTVNPDGTKFTESSWEYELYGKVFIPKRYILKKYISDDRIELQRDFNLVDCKLNEPIDDSYFGWERLGLAEGDQVQNDILGKVFRYSKTLGLILDAKYKELHPVAVPTVEVLEAKDNSGYSTLILINCGFLVVFMFLFLLRRFRST